MTQNHVKNILSIKAHIIQITHIIQIIIIMFISHFQYKSYILRILGSSSTTQLENKTTHSFWLVTGEDPLIWHPWHIVQCLCFYAYIQVTFGGPLHQQMNSQSPIVQRRPEGTNSD